MRENIGFIISSNLASPIDLKRPGTEERSTSGRENAYQNHSVRPTLGKLEKANRHLKAYQVAGRFVLRLMTILYQQPSWNVSLPPMATPAEILSSVSGSGRKTELRCFSTQDSIAPIQTLAITTKSWQDRRTCTTVEE